MAPPAQEEVEDLERDQKMLMGWDLGLQKGWVGIYQYDAAA